jgi:predicted lipase
MIPFDGQFAQNYVYPFALAAYNAEDLPNGYSKDNAFEILADVSAAFQARLDKIDPRHRKPLESMLAHPRRPRITDAGKANTAFVHALPRSVQSNQHFGWICVDKTNRRLVVAFRGTEYFQDWLDDFDFAPAPYSPIPGRGTVHQGFLIVYEAVRASVRATVEKVVNSSGAALQQIVIVGHSLGGALCGLCAPDLLNDLASQLAPVVYTLAEPRVGHPDYVRFFDTRVNVCYRIENLWDVVPHLPPVLALYEHEGASLHIDSGFSLDIVHNHVLVTGYAPGIAKWNADHPPMRTRLGIAPLVPMVGKTA